MTETKPPLGCREHSDHPFLNCPRCRTSGWGWLRSAVALARADAAAAQDATEPPSGHTEPSEPDPDAHAGAQRRAHDHARED